MATYKQTPLRVQPHHFSDSESEDQEWVVSSSGNRNLNHTVQSGRSSPTDEEGWQLVSGAASPSEIATPIPDAFSDVSSVNGSGMGGSSGFASDESEYAPDDYDPRTRHHNRHRHHRHYQHDNHHDNQYRYQNTQFAGRMPRHDGSGNFIEDVFSDASSDEPSVRSSQPTASGRSRGIYTRAGANLSESQQSIAEFLRLVQGRRLSSSERSAVSETETTADHVHLQPTVVTEEPHSWMSMLRSMFRIEEDVSAAIRSKEPLSPHFTNEDRGLRELTKTVRFELGELPIHPIRYLASTDYDSSSTMSTAARPSTESFDRSSVSEHNLVFRHRMSTHLLELAASERRPPRGVASSVRPGRPCSSRLRDPMGVNFSRTSRENSNETSLLSTVWTTFCRMTSHMVNPNTSVSSDSTLCGGTCSHALPSAASSASDHYQHSLWGTAAVLAGMDDGCYSHDGGCPPFGNHLVPSNLGWFPRSELDSYGAAAHQQQRTTTVRPNVIPASLSARRRLTPVSSSASLASLSSFTSRTGSDCGLEMGIERDHIGVRACI